MSARPAPDPFEAPGGERSEHECRERDEYGIDRLAGKANVVVENSGKGHQI